MRRFRYRPSLLKKELAEFCRAAVVPAELRETAAAILAEVQTQGDAALVRYTKKFSRVALKPAQFRVRSAEIARALKRLPAADRRALLSARASILAYNRRGRRQDWTTRNLHGAEVGERFYPLRRVGINVPGGQVPLVSTAIMTVTLAKLAGVPEIAVFSPCDAQGRIADSLLASFALCGATEVYRVGGVQGIGAMAYGTETIPAVDKIFGPSNAYVCEAMRQVFGTVGVAGLPGPSEVMVVADGTARADFAAADLLAQAEHGSGKEKVYLVATSAAFLDAVAAELKEQLARLGRAEAARQVLEKGFAAIEVTTLEEAAAVANFVAPEHLELLVSDKAARVLLKQITTAGAILIGNDSPTVLGDFTAGPSHVLPTGRSGRFFSGLRVEDFLRRTSVLRYDAASLRRAWPTVRAFSAMEQLDAHGRSAEIRLEKPPARKAAV